MANSNPPKALSQRTAGTLSALLGRKIQAEGPPETDLTKLVELARHIHKLKNPPKSKLKWSIEEFIFHWAWTKDEAAGGRVAAIPDWPYIRDLIHLVMSEDMVFFEKSRRMVVTWLMCAIDLWIIAGGHDERWPILMPTENNPHGGNRRVFIAARKLKEAAGSAEFVERVQFIYDQAVARGIRAEWPDFPEIKWSFGRGICSNGSRIDAVPQGPDQMPGAGATLVHGEEVAFWPELRASITRALPVLDGGGKMVLVTTANAAAAYCCDLVNDNLDPV